MRGKPKLIQRNDSPYWFIYVPPENGQRAKRFSTGETDYSQAEAVFAQWIIEGRKPELNEPDKIKVTDMLRRYAEYKESDATVQYHMRHLLPFFESYALSGVTAHTGSEYLRHRSNHFARRGKSFSARRISPATVRRELDTLVAALNYSNKYGYSGPIPELDKPQPSLPRQRWLDKDELNRLLASCKSEHLRAFVLIASITTSRPGAILELKWFQVDFEKNIIHFNPESRAQNNKHRPSVAMSSELAGFLKSIRENAKSEFVISFRGRPVRSLKKSFREAVALAGLTGVTPYTLRHTAITMLIRGGKTLAQAGQMAGHSDPRTTSRYAKHDASNTRDSAEMLSSGVELAHFAPNKAKVDQKSPKKIGGIQ